MEKNPYRFVTKDHKLRLRSCIEEMQSDPEKATSAKAYGWIVKANITLKLAGNPTSVLDVGWGWGRETICFENAVGIDHCLPWLKTAKNYSDNEFVLADAENLPFKNESFDFLVMSEVVEHINDQVKAIREVKRVLMRKGRIVVQTPNRSLTRGIVLGKNHGHVREFTIPELIRFLTRHSFRVLKRTGSTIPWIPSSTILSCLNYNRFFFLIWKTLNRLFPLKWDIIILAEVVK